MTNKINIDVSSNVKVAVVPQCVFLKRKTGQLLKDFGLLKHQRKAVHNLIFNFMHANSHQYSLGEVAPSDVRTHNSGLRKSRSLESIHTIKQGTTTCPLPLANTDSESDDDTPPPPPTTLPRDSDQSLTEDAVTININIMKPGTLECLEEKIKELESTKQKIQANKPDLSAMEKRAFLKWIPDVPYPKFRFLPKHVQNDLDRIDEEYQKELRDTIRQLKTSKQLAGQARKCSWDSTSEERYQELMNPKQQFPKQTREREIDDKIPDDFHLYIKQHEVEPPEVIADRKRRDQIYLDNKKKNAILEKEERVKNETNKIEENIRSIFNDPWFQIDACGSGTYRECFALSLSKYDTLKEFGNKTNGRDFGIWQYFYRKFRKYRTDNNNDLLAKYDDEHLYKTVKEIIKSK